MSQNTIKFARLRGIKKYSENHTHPEATVTMVLLMYYFSLSTHCK